MKFKLIICFLISGLYANSQLCTDYRLLDGDEKIIQYGMDTTDNWWAVTEPFSGKLRLYVNGAESAVYIKINIPVFSVNGDSWATFANDGMQYYVLYNDSIIPTKATASGSMEFNPFTDDLIYSYFVNNTEHIVFPTGEILVENKVGRTFLGPNNRFAFVGSLGSLYAVNVNGVEVGQYDRVTGIGFWSTGEFCYAAQNGNNWAIYKNGKMITQNFAYINNVVINRYGTVLAAIVENSSGKYQSLIISDEYYEPLIGTQYDNATGLVLHPSLPMIGYKALNFNNKYVVYNNTEYSSGKNSNSPRFSTSGDELYFLSCDMSCLLNINGRNFSLKNSPSLNTDFAMKPKSSTVAYNTSSSMILLFVESNYMHAGMMVDDLIAPRYNRIRDRYETLGRISNKLYMLTCKTN